MRIVCLLTRLTSVALTSVVLTACITAPASLAPPADESAPITATLDMSTDINADVTVTSLTFGSQGDTFLERIDDAVAELGAPASHQFVTTQLVTTQLVTTQLVTAAEDGAGVPWQGEALLYPAQTVIFLQPMQRGGDAAVRVDVPTGTDSGTEIDAAIAAARTTEPLRELTAMTTTVPAPDVDVTFVRARQTSDGVWTFDVTLNHPDTGWEDYVDGWHVATPDGEILGTRILLHPHTNEMPFTRSLSGVSIPADVGEVTVRSHDRISGYSPDVVAVPIVAAGSGQRYEVVR